MSTEQLLKWFISLQEKHIEITEGRAVALKRLARPRPMGGNPPRPGPQLKQLRIRVSPETLMRLEKLGFRRSNKCPSMLRKAVEGVAALWIRYPYDPCLYIKRCEDPEEADVCIDPRSIMQPAGETIEGNFLILTGTIHTLLAQGADPAEIASLVGSLMDAHKELEP